MVRGIALFGVLTVNLLTEFRVSLFDWLAHFHVGPRGPVSDGVDLVVAVLIEMKAFAMFSMLFGVGLAVQCDRRGRAFSSFVFRRLLALLAIGSVHMVFVWHGDILVTYAVAGALLTVLLRLQSARLLAAGLVLLAVGALPLPVVGPLPGDDHVTASILAYGQGSWSEALAFRLHELPLFLPLHLSVLPDTLGMMAFGAWTWRVGVWRGRYRRAVAWAAVVGVPVGVAASGWGVWHALHGVPPSSLLEALSTLAAAIGYTATAYLAANAARWLAPLGRMSLTNYLLQSLIWSFVFYGWGLGLYYELDAATAWVLGVGLYAIQVVLSRAWLRWFRFGPVEWVWRCASYARVVPILASNASP